MSRLCTMPQAARQGSACRGFTVIEVIIVVAMIAIVSGMASPFLADTLQRRDLSSFSAEAVDALREAQSAVMSGKNNARYGVHFQADRIVLFQGASYSAGDTNNVVHLLSGNVSITSVALSPGGACTLPAGTGNCDIKFADRRGVPSQTGSVVLTQTGTTTIRTVTINAAGMSDEN